MVDDVQIRRTCLPGTSWKLRKSKIFAENKKNAVVLNQSLVREKTRSSLYCGMWLHSTLYQGGRQQSDILRARWVYNSSSTPLQAPLALFATTSRLNLQLLYSSLILAVARRDRRVAPVGQRRSVLGSRSSKRSPSLWPWQTPGSDSHPSSTACHHRSSVCKKYTHIN